MSDLQGHSAAAILQSQFNLSPRLAELLELMVLQQGPARFYAPMLGVPPDTVRTYTQRIMEAMNAHSKAEVILRAKNALTEANESLYGPPLPMGDVLAMSGEFVAAGQFARADFWLGRLGFLAEGRPLDSVSAARLHLYLAELRGEQGLYSEAHKHAQLAFIRAQEAADNQLMQAAYLQTALWLGRQYNDEAALKLVQRLPSDEIDDRALRLRRDALEVTFGAWAGVESDMRQLQSVARRIERSGEGAVELARITQGLDALSGGKKLEVGDRWRPIRPITTEEETFRRTLVSWRQDVFPSSSTNANLLDMLNVTKEAIAEDAPNEVVEEFAGRGYALAREVGALRLAGVFEYYSPAPPLRSRRQGPLFFPRIGY